MPNYVTNVVKMEGICNLPLFVETEDGILGFDFNKIIPMPETLKVDDGSIVDVAIETVLRKMSEHRSLFDHTSYKHMKDEEYECRRSHYDSMDDTQLLELGLKYITNKVMYGATTWYDWCWDNWGTKWNSFDNTRHDENTIQFDTAWSAPVKVMLKLSEMYPDETIEHWWADEDTGNNTGHQVYKGGSVIEGGNHTNNSSEAYETYIFCRGKNKCLYKDDNGSWKHRDCETCNLCD